MEQASEARGLAALEDRFGGLWRVDRSIEDFYADQTGRFRGLARIRPQGDALRYEENGRLTLGASTTQASRAYLWRPGRGKLAHVSFEDGRAFHSFDWGRTISEDSHICGEDRYAVRYSFTAASWRAHWRVVGPRKDYQMNALYIRPA